MNNTILNQHINLNLNNYNLQLEQNLESDVVSYVGVIYQLGSNPLLDNLGYTKFLNTIEYLVKNKDPNQKNKDSLYILLSTTGGNIETVEKLVNITRYHYKEVFFIIPHIAMSAGTVWALSGNKIFMDYSSSLGPIDPQINGIPALGYLDKVNELITKSATKGLSEAELILLKGIDLGQIRLFEQAKDLSIELLKKWLSQYQLKNLLTSKKIAKDLSNHNKWHAHGRLIGIETLINMGVCIEDYSKDIMFRDIVRYYNSLLNEYIQKENIPILVHNRRFP